MGKAKSILGVAVIGLFTTFSASALADDDCLGGVNTVCFEENELTLFGDPAVEYIATNNTDTSLFGFGVTNDAEYNDYDIDTRTSAGEEGWGSTYLSQQDWDNGFGYFSFYPPKGVEQQQLDFLFNETWITGEAPVSTPDRPIKEPLPGTVYLGSFEDLFGSDDTHVSFFWNRNIDNPLEPGEVSDNNFLQFAFENSEATAFGAGGGVVATTLPTTAVPEPETYAMFLAGLGLLGFASRKKQA